MARSWAYSACCGLSIVLLLLPSPWHWKARNTGTLLYIGWAVTGNFIFMVNSIIWNGNYEKELHGWCDVVIHLIIGMSIGLVMAGLCINRRLYDIATIKSVTIDRDSRRRRIMVDLLLGVGFPIVVMCLAYVTQSNRYDILEDIGCWPPNYPTLPGIFLSLWWPIPISTASLFYAVMSIRAFLRARRQFTQALGSGSHGINMSRYFRMMGLSCGEILCSLPLSIYILVSTLHMKMWPWVSWADTHYKWAQIHHVPAIALQQNMVVWRAFMVNQWIVPAGGFLFFLWFGLAGEALDEYKKLFYFLVRPFGIKPSPPKPKVVLSGNSNWVSRIGSSLASGQQNTAMSLPELSQIQSSPTDEKSTQHDITEEKLDYKAPHASSAV
ncbi:STE3-type pheromone receptor [Ceratobasidium sp. AG-Ba]|nr:STE3-type pheromone receptor [Ceratobasidium sp. AG-Ba]QRW11027.1 STE3-type pheromone receptor [Ceratobasidium sp. AG-Ba]